MTELVLIAHNVRSAHNIGSLLRTADGMGVGKIWLTGYTPYPQREKDPRLPHIASKMDRQITKTALGAEKLVNWQHSVDIENVIDDLKRQGYMVAALEQSPSATKLPDFEPPDKLALVVGREVGGIETAVLKQCDHILEIPMFGRKESFNVVLAAAMALYHLKFPR